ncbi:hypothetical protein [Ruminococcus sp.]|uniref:hypothetical protein n=1 Tax=Ruminococcus sp. TaxID=41978 RepID=UPI003F7F452C
MNNKYLEYDRDDGFTPIVRSYSESGFIDDELLTDEPQLIQNVVKIWIDWCCIPIKTRHSNCTSYGLKHRFEHMTGIYLTNNQFKQAMLLCGFYPDNDISELNWNYSLSKKSLCFSDYKHRGYRFLIRDMIYAKEENR